MHIVFRSIAPTSLVLRASEYGVNQWCTILIPEYLLESESESKSTQSNLAGIGSGMKDWGPGIEIGIRDFHYLWNTGHAIFSKMFQLKIKSHSRIKLTNTSISVELESESKNFDQNRNRGGIREIFLESESESEIYKMLESESESRCAWNCASLMWMETWNMAK